MEHQNLYRRILCSYIDRYEAAKISEIENFYFKAWCNYSVARKKIF